MKLSKILFLTLVVMIAVTGVVTLSPTDTAEACLPCNCPVENPPINCYGDFTLFLHRTEGVEGFDIEVLLHSPDGDRERVIYLTAQELAKLPDDPEEHILIAEAPTIQLFKMDWGEYQINGGPYNEDKVYVTIFSADHGSRIEEYDFILERR